MRVSEKRWKINETEKTFNSFQKNSRPRNLLLSLPSNLFESLISTCVLYTLLFRKLNGTNRPLWVPQFLIYLSWLYIIFIIMKCNLVMVKKFKLRTKILIPCCTALKLTTCMKTCKISNTYWTLEITRLYTHFMIRLTKRFL